MKEEKKELPEGWRWVKLGEICETQTGIRDPRLTPEKSFHYIDISGVDNKLKKIIETKTIIGKDAPSRARQIVKVGDVIVSTTRPNLNAVALIPLHLNNEICSTGFCVLRPHAVLISHYLFTFVQSNDFVKSLSDLVKGALYPAVTNAQVQNQLIPLPPLPEQKRIAAILQEQLAAVEKARKAADEQLEAVKALPSACLRQVFPQPDQELPEGWRRTKLKDLGIFEAGGTPAKENIDYWNGEIPFVTGADITNLNIRKSHARAFLSQSGLYSGKTAICKPNTVLIVTRTRVGRIGIARELMGVSQDITAFHCNDGIIPEFLYHYLHNISEYLIENCRGATIQGLTRNIVGVSHFLHKRK